MNRLETRLVNSAPRRWLQRYYEVPQLRRLGARIGPAARVLELGCGSGYGTQLILDKFGASSVDAIDLDPAMIDRARRRLARSVDRVRLAQGSATDLWTAFKATDDSYDVVFDFAIIHHIPDWRAALNEVARVLKPGGLFVFDEVTAEALATRTYRLLFDHPAHDRFTAHRFVDALEDRKLRVGDRFVTRRAGHYVLGVANLSA
ncbi:class I SAM-dependent methyltransferase [Rhodococcus ruber]|nr:class I SAM-dependent methyltransferase [Rhodococcus ruber]MCD2127231.1 class I SAM-dependent methyltransferase [Rhodococcus ruber]MCZ4503172.1 class I SAM-dependent methyltransferase [Rhodococcus ruber]MCZ4530733.1 class I SAM-dependent methyltransferase [Rhodococcus ruber]MCZ4621567.1 class I SAM-dependent methyltransferase [Rhodococcus ruber]MDI9969451.1 class I SAM-dependent methyltransferase [Rhodococcus ruber]